MMLKTRKFVLLGLSAVLLLIFAACSAPSEVSQDLDTLGMRFKNTTADYCDGTVDPDTGECIPDDDSGSGKPGGGPKKLTTAGSETCEQFDLSGTVCLDEYLAIVETGTLTGLGNSGSVIASVSGFPLFLCGNPGKYTFEAPGVNPVDLVEDSGDLTFEQPRNGRFDFNLVLDGNGIDFTDANLPECPNTNWLLILVALTHDLENYPAPISPVDVFDADPSALLLITTTAIQDDGDVEEIVLGCTSFFDDADEFPDRLECIEL
ncbi:MAG: hypothetical protein JSV66_08250 [Trueperaceae bacterium]|nr:MAG: hypothetical protein JSV66_08250 [Trueperaceae bacterium]